MLRSTGPLLGVGIVGVVLIIVGGVIWWVCTGITDWFTYHSEASDMLMWSLVAALILTVFAIPAAAWGIAARAWVIRLRDDERAEATARVLLAAQGAPRRAEIIEPRRGEVLAAPTAPQAPRLVHHQTPTRVRRRTVSSGAPAGVPTTSDAAGHRAHVDD